MAAGEESGALSTIREGGACSSEEILVCSPLNETVGTSGMDPSGGVDVLFCGVLITRDRTRKEQRMVVVCLFAAAYWIVGAVGHVDSRNVTTRRTMGQRLFPTHVYLGHCVFCRFCRARSGCNC
jgi:hypothetical protein